MSVLSADPKTCYPLTTYIGDTILSTYQIERSPIILYKPFNSQPYSPNYTFSKYKNTSLKKVQTLITNVHKEQMYFLGPKYPEEDFQFCVTGAFNTCDDNIFDSAIRELEEELYISVPNSSHIVKIETTRTRYYTTTSYMVNIKDTNLIKTPRVEIVGEDKRQYRIAIYVYGTMEDYQPYLSNDFSTLPISDNIIGAVLYPVFI